MEQEVDPYPYLEVLTDSDGGRLVALERSKHFRVVAFEGTERHCCEVKGLP